MSAWVPITSASRDPEPGAETGPRPALQRPRSRPPVTALVADVGPLTLTLRSLSGRSGLGVRRLVADVDVFSRPVAGDPVLLDLTAEVAITTRAGGQLPLGAGRFDRPLVLGSAGGTAQLTVDMTDGQVEQIEVPRDGEGLELAVQVAGVSHHPDRPSEMVQGYYQWAVSSTSWAAAFDQAGAVQTATVTLLLPVDGPGRDRPQVAAALRDARLALADGRWSDAIIGCRHVLELAGLTGGALKAAKHQRPKDERFAALAGALAALYDVASAAAHRDDVTSSFDWGRADATAAVACCVALLHQHDVAARRP